MQQTAERNFQFADHHSDGGIFWTEQFPFRSNGWGNKVPPVLANELTGGATVGPRHSVGNQLPSPLCYWHMAFAVSP